MKDPLIKAYEAINFPDWSKNIAPKVLAYMKKEEKRKQKIRSAFILIGSILLCGVILLISGCREPVWAKVINLKASWYSIESLKKEGTYKYSKGAMANGKLFDDNAFTCANRLYPLDSILRITNLKSGNSIIVRTTDRIGKRFARTRIDLSKKAMETLGGKQALEKGLLLVKVERIK
jgi:hypothetical protein